MNKATLKKLIPVWVDNNNEYREIKGYLIHKDTGKVYSNKNPGTKSLVPNKYFRKKEYVNSCGYPIHKLKDKCFTNLYKNTKDISSHRLVVISNIFHFNTLVEKLIKAYPHISEKVIEELPREIQEELLRGLDINHKDHNKENFKHNNLELVSAQGNSSAYQKHKKQKAL